eukprot:COSAG02_NODE_174_length_31243_cov_76.084543_2_plen_174_part_00
MPATSHSMRCSSKRSHSRNMGGVHCLARPHRPRPMLQSIKVLQPHRKDEHSTADDRIHAVWTVATRHPRAPAVAATHRAATLQFACMPLRGERRRSLSADFNGRMECTAFAPMKQFCSISASVRSVALHDFAKSHPTDACHPPLDSDEPSTATADEKALPASSTVVRHTGSCQ